MEEAKAPSYSNGHLRLASKVSQSQLLIKKLVVVSVFKKPFELIISIQHMLMGSTLKRCMMPMLQLFMASF